MIFNVDYFKKYYANATKEEVIEDMFLDCREQAKEIERLNNIINKLERYINKTIIDGGTRGSMTFWYRQIYDYLQELKGDKNNGNNI